MRVSSNHNFIFINNARCASTSIDVALQSYSNFGHEHCDDPTAARNYCANDLKVYFDHMNDIDEATWDWGNYYKFTTIRNPFTRWVSYYFAHSPDKDGVSIFSKNYDKESKFGIGFNAWVEKMISDGAGLPNYEWLCLNHQTQESLVDKVIKVEDIETEFPIFMKNQFDITIESVPRLDIGMQPKESHETVDPFGLYNNKAKQIVEQVYESDLSLFNYEFGQ